MISVTKYLSCYVQQLDRGKIAHLAWEKSEEEISSRVK